MTVLKRAVIPAAASVTYAPPIYWNFTFVLRKCVNGWSVDFYASSRHKSFKHSTRKYRNFQWSNATRRQTNAAVLSAVNAIKYVLPSGVFPGGEKKLLRDTWTAGHAFLALNFIRREMREQETSFRQTDTRYPSVGRSFITCVCMTGSSY